MNESSKVNAEHYQMRPLPVRIDKTLDWLEKSRDAWKDKCLKAKLELKIKTLSVKRLQGGRDKWKHRKKMASTVIQQMESERSSLLIEIERLKKELVKEAGEVERLKKKS